MKTSYNILWIEDNFSHVESSISGLLNRFAEQGFNLVVEKRSGLNYSDIDLLKERLKTYNPYDMIVFDFELGEGQLNGSQIAKELRANIYTDMIFYSGKSVEAMRKALYDEEVDGVYIVHRSAFLDDAWLIFEDNIRKICDINSMRGVLLDEMSSVDLNMRHSLALKYLKLDDNDKEKFMEKMIKTIERKIKDLNDKREKISLVSISDLVIDPLFTDFEFIRGRLRNMTEGDLFHEGGLLASKQQLRNKFAHCMSDFDEARGVMLLAGNEEVYGHQQFKEIRKKLAQLSTAIRAHYNSLKP